MRFVKVSFRLALAIVLAVSLSCRSGPTSPDPSEHVPQILGFAADPPVIHHGETAVLSWAVRNAAHSEIDRGIGTVPSICRMEVRPEATTTYTLTATNAFGTANKSCEIRVLQMDLSGSWSGAFRIRRFNQSGTISFTLFQTNGNVTGTFYTTTRRYGNMDGTIVGNAVAGTMTFVDSCKGEAALEATVDIQGNTMSGTGKARDCLGSYTITFDVTRQSSAP